MVAKSVLQANGLLQAHPFVPTALLGSRRPWRQHRQPSAQTAQLENTQLLAKYAENVALARKHPVQVQPLVRTVNLGKHLNLKQEAVKNVRLVSSLMPKRRPSVTFAQEAKAQQLVPPAVAPAQLANLQMLGSRCVQCVPVEKFLLLEHMYAIVHQHLRQPILQQMHPLHPLQLQPKISYQGSTYECNTFGSCMLD